MSSITSKAEHAPARKKRVVKSLSSLKKSTKLKRSALRLRGSAQPPQLGPIRARLSSSYHLFRQAVSTLVRNKKLYGGILGIYAALYLLLVQGLGGSANIQTIKASFDEVVQGRGGELVSAFSVFAYLLSGSDSATTTANAGVYQMLLLIVGSLALIWALRQTYSRSLVRVRDSFYRGMAPFVPFILVLLVVGLQLLPFVVAALLYGIVMVNGIAVHALEQILWACLLFGGLILSLYLVASSIIALYIVTLPDMTPMKALKSARELVRFRRWTVLRKMLFLPVALLMIMAVILIPVIVWLTPLAAGVYFILMIMSLAVVHSYLYALYRELLI